MQRNKLDRFQLVQYIIPVAFLAGIFLSLELWFPLARSFPRAPLISLPKGSILLIERLLSTILIASLILIVVKHRAKIFAIVAIVSCVMMILFDQMRLQPWVYQYLLFLSVITLNNWYPPNKPNLTESNSNINLALLQLIVAALYIWGGVQKFNFSFMHETLPILLLPLQKILPAPPLVVLGVGIALMEVFIGCGLLFHYTRKLCIGLAVAMHAMVLTLLIIKDYNSIVWIWNVTLMIMVVVLFWQSEEVTWQILFNWRILHLVSRLVQALIIATTILPGLSFFGLWDMYLSGALYSGNTIVAVIHIDKDLFEKLPPIAQKQVFNLKNSEQILPLLEWSMAEMNVPPYPETRVYKQLAHQICQLSPNNEKIELVMKGRPAILDGSYQVTRIKCTELEK